MLELKNLTKIFDSFTLGPISIRVDDEVLVLLGPSGCGKSTLLSIIAGITPQDTGTVSLDGESLDSQPPEARCVGLVFQDGALFPHMTAWENIEYAAIDTNRIEALVDALEIADILDQPTPTLSGGERQRVALTRVLASDPDVLLLDEPLANLDTPIKKRLRDELHELFDSLSIPVIYVTHDQEAATALGDRTAVLRDGTIEQIGTADNLRAAPQTSFVASFIGVGNVFETTIRHHSTETSSLVLGDETYSIEAPDRPESRRPGELIRPDVETAQTEPVIVCIRATTISIAVADELPSVAPGTVTFEGCVERAIDEGTSTRVVCTVEGLDTPLFVTVIPATNEPGITIPGTPVRLSVFLDDIHLIPHTK